MAYKGNLRKWEVKAEVQPILKGTLVTFGPWDFGGLDLKTLTITNRGADALDRGVVEVSADGNIWGTISATTFNTLGSAAVARDYFNDTNRWWRIKVASTGGTGTVHYFWTF